MTTTPQTQQKPLAEPTTSARFTPEDLARRRTASRRLAWVLGAVALSIYLLGLFFKR